MSKFSNIKYPRLITLTASLFLFIMLFLPFATATKEYEEYLLERPNVMHTEEIGMTNSEAARLSLVDYVRVYSVAFDMGYEKEQCIVGIALIALYMLFSLLAVILSLCNKPIGIIVFDLLAMLFLWLNHFDFKSRGVLPSSTYNWGVVNYITYLIGGIVLWGAIWLCKEKKREKEQEGIEE